MKKFILFTILSAVSVNAVLAQKTRPQFPNGATRPKAEDLKLATPIQEQGVPTVSPVFSTPTQIRTLPSLQTRVSDLPKGFKVISTAAGLPTMVEGSLPVNGNAKELPLSERCTQYLGAMKTAMKIQNPEIEFVIKSIEADEVEQTHVRMTQKLGNIPVWGSEIILHDKGGKVGLMNGFYFPTPSVLSLEPTILAASSGEIVRTDLSKKFKFNTFTENGKKQIGGEQIRNELVIFHVKDDKNMERLAWHVIAYPSVLHRWEYFVDAENGTVLDSYESSCDFMGHYHDAIENSTILNKNSSKSLENSENAENTEGGVPLEKPAFDGKTFADAKDMLGVTQRINTYQVGTRYYLIDASRSMFKPASSSFPANPVGVVQTFDNLNKDGGETYNYITTTNNVWSDTKAVSAHFNSGKCYEYYLATHARNSLDGRGGNIDSYINVTDKSVQMDNAYWNGEAMFYGNGKDFFSPLPKALDVAGHEISHGVIQNTANLRYQGESGAMNESFADVFGAMIERKNWAMGEDVIKNLSAFPTGFLRDLSNPNNGATKGQSAWQPKVYSDRYTGSQDNGGVHINSGIPNYAFYLFATNTAVGKDKAEKVYYSALKNYLFASAQFIDLRTAVEAACKAIYPSDAAILTAAQNAFTTVGIGAGGSTSTTSTTAQNLPTNPGQDYIVYLSSDKSKLSVKREGSLISTATTLYSGGVLSRPSVSDDGSKIVFIGTDTRPYIAQINWATGAVTAATQIFQSTFTGINNIAISKDGTKLAMNYGDSSIIVYSYTLSKASSFVLYNPTTSQTTINNNNVRFCDALEWDASGEFVMYDAQTITPGQTAADDADYWDIGFVNVWSNSARTFGSGQVQKLFGSIPENASVGNPTFAKNAPYIIAFEYLEKDPTTQNFNLFYIVTENIQTGALSSLDVPIFNNSTISYPSFTRLDDRILFTNKTSTGALQLATVNLSLDKLSATNAGIVLSDYGASQRGNSFSNGKRVISATAETLDKADVQIAPNPFKDLVNIAINSAVNADGKIEIFDLLGRAIITRPLSISAGKNAIDVPTQTLNEGAYLVRVTVDGKSLTAKIMKQ